MRDCTTTPSPDGFGSGFLEYTLEHDGMHSPILDWHQVPRVFDFGIAPIEHGKALAAERYITGRRKPKRPRQTPALESTYRHDPDLHSGRPLRLSCASLAKGTVYRLSGPALKLVP